MLSSKKEKAKVFRTGEFLFGILHVYLSGGQRPLVDKIWFTGQGISSPSPPVSLFVAEKRWKQKIPTEMVMVY